MLRTTARIQEKISIIYKATRQHARNLAVFALIYKSACLAIKSTNGGKERSLDTFAAGLLGGYYVFGQSMSSVNQQIVIYVAARVILAAAALAIQPPGKTNDLIGGTYGVRGGAGLIHLSESTRERIRRGAWPVFASLSWASVMWLFRWYPDMLHPSLKSSMTYMSVYPYVVTLLLYASFSFLLLSAERLLYIVTDFFVFPSDMIMRTTGTRSEHFLYITNEIYYYYIRDLYHLCFSQSTCSHCESRKLTCAIPALSTPSTSTRCAP